MASILVPDARDAIPAPPAAAGRVAWHLGWLAFALISAVVWAAFPRGAGASAALACVSAGGLAGLILGRRRGLRADLLLLCLWTAGITAAVLVSGGPSGPLAVLAVVPLAAARLLGGRRNLAAGGVLFIVCIAALALAQAGGIHPPFPRPWLTVLAIVAAGAALVSSLMLSSHRRVSRPRETAPSEARSSHPAQPDAYASGASALLEAQGLLILDIGPGGTIRGAFGTDPSFGAAHGGDFANLAADPHPLDAARARARTQGRAEIAFAPAAAPDRTFAAVLTPMADGVVAVLRDATAEAAHRAALEQTAADALAVSAGKSRFLANMSHELRTPLNAVVGFSDIMRGQMFGPLAPKYAEYAELIHESGGHLLDLINDVLDLSKIEAERYDLTMEGFDARDAVAASLRLMRGQAETAEISLRAVLGPEPIRVRADRRALKQIIFNLVSNSLKFTPPGGSVTVGLRAADDALELVVGDTGVGIAPGDLERLGARFEQAGAAEQKARGSGLGLSLVRALCALHGGEMSIQSTLGEGTVVAVRLPVLAPAAPAAQDDFAPPFAANVIAFTPNR